jgi:hypothetical protein
MEVRIFSTIINSRAHHACTGDSKNACLQGPRPISAVTNRSLKKGPSSQLQLIRAPTAFCSGGVET